MVIIMQYLDEVGEDRPSRLSCIHLAIDFMSYSRRSEVAHMIQSM